MENDGQVGTNKKVRPEFGRKMRLCFEMEWIFSTEFHSMHRTDSVPAKYHYHSKSKPLLLAGGLFIPFDILLSNELLSSKE